MKPEAPLAAAGGGSGATSCAGAAAIAKASRSGVISPDFASFLAAHHRVPCLARERLLERRQIRERPDHPVLGDRVRVPLHHQALRLGPDLVAPELSPGDEEL